LPLPPTPPRLTSHPLPCYAYVPGLQPHPISESTGHSFGIELETVEMKDAESCWERHGWGADLFNHGYYWEAHEAWESIWIAAGRVGVEADRFKGLIKLAAAGVKARQSQVSGVQRHARRAAELFHRCAESSEAAGQLRTGLDDLWLYQQSIHIVEQADRLIDTTPCAVKRVLPLVLEPRVS
jgi:uncharacterized protein